MAGIPRQEIETGDQNFGRALKMIMGLTVANIFKICPRLERGTLKQNTLRAILAGLQKKQLSNTTRWQHRHKGTNDWFATKATQSRAEVK